MRIRPLISMLLAASILAGFSVYELSHSSESKAADSKVSTTIRTGKDVSRTYTRKEIEQIVTETIAQHPQMIIDSVQAMQTNQEQQEHDQALQAVQAYKTSLFDDTHAPMTGNAEGDVTIVEFFDYNCGYCKRTFPELMKLVEEDKNLHVVFKDYPVIAPSSDVAARAALAMNAIKPERYYDFHAALFRLAGRFDDDSIGAIAEGMGVDKKTFLAKMNDEAITKQIEANRDLAAKLGAKGVPLFVIGKEIFPGALSYDMLKEEVAKIRAEKK